MFKDICVIAQQHRFTYNEPMPVESCTQSLCDLALQFGEDDEEGGMVSRFTQSSLSPLHFRGDLDGTKSTQTLCIWFLCKWCLFCQRSN